MKYVIRVVALAFVLAGAAAVSLSYEPVPTAPNHLSATSGLPVPICRPGMSCAAGAK